MATTGEIDIGTERTFFSMQIDAFDHAGEFRRREGRERQVGAVVGSLGPLCDRYNLALEEVCGGEVGLYELHGFVPPNEADHVRREVEAVLIRHNSYQ